MPMGLGTRAHELALFVVLRARSRWCRTIRSTTRAEGFDFIKQVPATWDEIRALGGRPMEWITVARRSGKDWYVGSLTNWDERDGEGAAELPRRGQVRGRDLRRCARRRQEATHTTFTKQAVDRTTVLDVHMVSGGGNAIWIHPAE